MQRIVMTVISDLVSDQRVHKVATTLNQMGYDVLLIGRKLPFSQSLNSRNYKTKRLKVFFTKGPLAYAEFNFRLFFYLLFLRFNTVLANDLDVLLASYLASKIRRKKIVYDSHEYFTEVPELIGRKFARNTWLRIEKWILPKIKSSYTVCDSIAKEYQQLYNISMKVVRNVPILQEHTIEEIEIPTNKNIILYQGALNVGRGVEHVIRAMKYIENAIFLIIGTGDIEKELQELVKQEKLESKILFIGKIPFSKLFSYTHKANLGICLQEDMGLSYRYVLPNRLFDYIHAEIPVLGSDVPEIKNIMMNFNVGLLTKDYSEKSLSETIKDMLENKEQIIKWKNACKFAKKELSWQNEEKVLKDIFSTI